MSQFKVIDHTAYQSKKNPDNYYLAKEFEEDGRIEIDIEHPFKPDSTFFKKYRKVGENGGMTIYYKRL